MLGIANGLFAVALRRVSVDLAPVAAVLSFTIIATNLER